MYLDLPETVIHVEATCPPDIAQRAVGLVLKILQDAGCQQMTAPQFGLLTPEGQRILAEGRRPYTDRPCKYGLEQKLEDIGLYSYELRYANR